jgi:hypothetical protein
MTLGWVLNGERRHAGQQEELILRGHWINSEEGDDPRMGAQWRQTPRWTAGEIDPPRQCNSCKINTITINLIKYQIFSLHYP